MKRCAGAPAGGRTYSGRLSGQRRRAAAARSRSPRRPRGSGPAAPRHRARPRRAARARAAGSRPAARRARGRPSRMRSASGPTPLATSLGAAMAGAVVAQRHRDMGRVGDHHGRPRHLGHHPAARALHAQAPQARLDDRIALGLLELVLQVAARHAQLLAMLEALVEAVEQRDQPDQHARRPASSRSARPCSTASSAPASSSAAATIGRHGGPQQRDAGRADQRDLDHALAELDQRAQREQAPRAGRAARSARAWGSSGSALSTSPCWISPPASAAPTSSTAASSSAAPTSPSSPASSRSRSPAASAMLWGRCEQRARGHAARSPASAGATGADQQRAGRQHQRVVDLARARDLALAARLVEPPLGRLLGLLPVVLFVGHGRSAARRPGVAARPRTGRRRPAARPRTTA